MPVPVPSVSTAHSISKCNNSGDFTGFQSSVFHLLKGTLPSSPIGPPPSFSSREQWISSLPAWRQTKTRHVWDNDPSSAAAGNHQGFCKGLAGAVNAPAIKGAHVQACIPPLNTLLQDCDSEMVPQSALNSLGSEQSQLSSGYWASSSLEGVVPQDLVEEDIASGHGWSPAPDLYFEDDAGLFAPVLEDDSPDMVGADLGSSPIEPVTPFGDYVDRAVAATDTTVPHDPLAPPRPQGLQFPFSVHCDSQLYHPHSFPYIDPKEELIVPAIEQPPVATLTHKQLAEPMAEWIVSYAWKVCSNALVLPRTIAPYTLPNAPQLRQSMPLCLVARVHSLLMSTLLQPSAMLLALWYIVRLPVYLGASGLGPEHVKERRFRVELLSDSHDGLDGESAEGIATFRLIVLGCMLANKWLDDHTFSNKTWHSISNVPVQLLNKLEYFALDILSHDLSISLSAWSQWLNHLLSYHHSLSTTTYPQPISRPASNPNGIIRKTIQEIMEAPLGHPADEPVFLGVEQRLKEKFGIFSPESESFDIDLDEDGPLREEYLPKRRVSSWSSLRGHSSEPRNDGQTGVSSQNLHHPPLHQVGIALPPPAKWSPAGDEPIYRSGGRADAIYLPVQPSLAPHYVGTAPPPWPPTSLPYAPFRQQVDGAYVMNTQPVPHYTYWATVNPSSAVQHPQSMWTSDYYAGPTHGYSHGAFEYRCKDIRLLSEGTGYHAQQAVSWTPSHQHCFAPSRHSLGLHPFPLSYRSSWLRA